MHADLNSILMELLMAEVSALLRAKKIWDQYRKSMRRRYQKVFIMMA